MKYLIGLAAGVVLLAYGLAFADDAGRKHPDGTVITNDDLPLVTPDQGGATFNRMPEEKDAAGSAPGGMSSKKPGKAPDKKKSAPPAMPSDSGQDRDTDSWSGY